MGSCEGNNVGVCNIMTKIDNHLLEPGRSQSFSFDIKMVASGADFLRSKLQLKQTSLLTCYPVDRNQI